MPQQKIYWRMLGSFLSGLFSPQDSSFWNFCCLQKFKLQFFHPKSTESVENIMLIFFFSLLHLFVPRCEPANTLRTKRFREVCLVWIYYPYWQDLCPLSSDCSWSVFEVFKHCFMFLFCFFFPNFIDVLCGEIKLSTSEGVLHTYGHLWSTSYRGIHNQYILLYWINKKHILLLKWTSKTSYIPTCFIAANTYF